MNPKISSSLLHYNYTEMNVVEQYRAIAAFMGLSESAFNILYAICQEGDGCSQSSVYKNSGMSRKTAGSSLHRLQDEGILRLEKGPERGNRVLLTEDGRRLVKERILPVIEAENEEFASWTKEERESYERLGKRFLDGLTARFACLREEMEKKQEKPLREEKAAGRKKED